MTTPTGILFNDPQPKPLSTTGQPQAGAYYLFFLTGTLTLAPVYADGALTTALSQTPGAAQPSCTADSAGRFNPIYLKPTLTYRVQLFNAGGSKLEDTDPYVVPGLGTQATIGAILFPQTAAEIAASITPTNYGYPPNNVRRYGCVLDGTTDDTGAFVSACTVGGELEIDGPMALASASVAVLNSGHGIILKSNTVIRFLGNGSITITGTTACNLFYSLNQTNIQLIDPVITGNGSTCTPTSSTGYVWYCKADSTAVADIHNCQVIGGTITDFCGYYWVYFDNSAGTNYIMYGCNVEGTTFITALGDCQGNASITITSALVGYSGSDSVSYFGIRDCRVSKCAVYGAFIKQVAIFWSGVYQCSAFDNTVIDCGTDSSISDDMGSYAFTAYDHSHGAALGPDLIEFYDNQVSGVRDCGIYCAGANRVCAHGNFVAGQTCTVITTLPKGAIVSNSSKVFHAASNTFDNCAYGLAIVAASGDLAVADDTTITNASTCGVLVQPTTAGTYGDVVIDGLVVAATGTSVCLRLDSTSTNGLKNFTLRNFRFTPSYTGLEQYSADASVPALGNVRIANGEIHGTVNVGINYQGCSNAATRTSFDNIKFYSSAAASEDFIVIGSTGLNINGITFNDRTSGSTYCWYGAGAQGTVANVMFNNVSASLRYTGSSCLGTGAPGWTGNDCDWVQNFNPTIAGSGGFGTANQKHFTAGWMYDVTNAAWMPDVRLTGT